MSKYNWKGDGTPGGCDSHCIPSPCGRCITGRPSPIRELILENDHGSPCIHLDFDIETGEILRLENWHGCEVSARWEKIAAERVYEERVKHLESQGMSTSDAQAVLDAEGAA